jgi:hypothetical protein
MTKQDNLNRLYAQILKIDECGKDFLEKIVTETAAKRGYTVMSPPAKEFSGENRH